VAGVDREACRCLLPSDTAQNDPDALTEIENEESDAILIPVQLQLLKVEAAALLDVLDKSDAIYSYLNKTDIYRNLINY
jgi:hypothetical protein